MKLPKRITATWLIENGACSADEFRRVFPAGAAVTVTNIQKALDADLDVLWLLERLPRSARAKYKKAIAPARAKYDKATAAARAEFLKVTAAAWAEFLKVTAAAWAEYDKATTTALVKVWDEWSEK